MEMISRRWRAVTSACRLFIDRHRLLQLFSGGAIQTFLVVDPAQRIDEAWHSGTCLHGALRQSHCFVQVAFAGMNGVQPGEIIRGKDRILVMRQRFAIVIDRRVDVLSVHLEHANQSVGGSVVGTMLDNLGVLGNGTLLLIRIHEQSA